MELFVQVVAVAILLMSAALVLRLSNERLKRLDMAEMMEPIETTARRRECTPLLNGKKVRFETRSGGELVARIVGRDSDTFVLKRKGGPSFRRACA